MTEKGATAIVDRLRARIEALQGLLRDPEFAGLRATGALRRLEAELEALTAAVKAGEATAPARDGPPPGAPFEAPSAGRSVSESDRWIGMVDQLPGVFWTTDPELRFTSSFGAGLTSLGLEVGEVVGVSLYAYFGTEDRDFLPIAAHRRALDGERAQYEFVWEKRTFSTQVTPLRDANGRIVGTAGAALDITDRKVREEELRHRHDELERRVKERTRMLSDAVARMERELAERLQAEEALRHSQARFRAIVEDQTDLICRFLPDFTLTFVNGAYCRYFGRRHEELIGHSLLPQIEEEDRDRVRREIRALSREKSTTTLEHRVVRADRRIGWQQWTSRMLFDDEGRFIEYQAVGRDLTELKAAQERAMQAERLAAIGQVVTGLAHESRNALQRSQACLERLALRVQDRPEVADLIEGIQNAQDHLHQLYEAVRSYAAPIRLEVAPCHLGEVIQEAWSHLVRQWRGRDVEIGEEFEGVDPRLEADPFALQQVMRNVLENALNACEDPVRIRIRLSEELLDERPAIACAIRDNGPGLTPEARTKIFEPFFTTKIRGTGLGMAISRRIVQAHGGRVGAGGNHGEGTEIVITLPRSRA